MTLTLSHLPESSFWSLRRRLIPTLSELACFRCTNVLFSITERDAVPGAYSPFGLISNIAMLFLDLFNIVAV